MINTQYLTNGAAVDNINRDEAERYNVSVGQWHTYGDETEFETIDEADGIMTYAEAREIAFGLLQTYGESQREGGPDINAMICSDTRLCAIYKLSDLAADDTAGEGSAK